MWKVYKWNGHYIMGDLVSKHSSEDAALKKAAKEIKFTFADKTKKDKETGEKVSMADTISELLSQHYNLNNFNIKNIIPKNLRQTVSMDSEFDGSGDSKTVKVSTPEIKEATKDFNDVVKGLGIDILNQLGIKDKNDFNSDTKINKIANKLRVMGNEEDASDVEGAWDQVKSAKNKSSEFRRKETFVDDAEDGYGGMFEGVETFEGFDIDVLMSRVMKKISK